MSFCLELMFFFFSSRRRHTRFDCDWSSDVCSSDLHTREHHRARFGDAEGEKVGLDGAVTVEMVDPHGRVDQNHRLPRRSARSASRSPSQRTFPRIASRSRRCRSLAYSASAAFTAAFLVAKPPSSNTCSSSASSSSMCVFMSPKCTCKGQHEVHGFMCLMYIGCDPLGPCPRGVRRFPRLAQHLEPVDQPMRSTLCTGTP